MSSLDTKRETSAPRSVGAAPLVVALVGNPNCGKTTLFNALTGLRHKVGNYPGVTVEKKEGFCALDDGRSLRILDLPGLYSLSPHSPDEVIAREVLLGLRPDTPRPDVILNVVDATNLERNLYLTSQLLDIGTPVAIALSMVDMVDRQGDRIDAEILAEAVGAPVCPVIATKRAGLDELRAAIAEAAASTIRSDLWNPPAIVKEAVRPLQAALEKEYGITRQAAFAEACALLMQAPDSARLSASVRGLVAEASANLAVAEIDFASTTIEARYAWIAGVCGAAMRRAVRPRRTPFFTNDRIDRVVMHPFWGYVIFLVVMTIVFQSIFTWVQAPMDWLRGSVDSAGVAISHWMPAGDLRDLLIKGVLGGVGNTVVFLPQILVLFFFISLLEDSGYMARAAFLMDRLMSKVGLHGRSFIPLLSSFACAIPGIMATRVIGDRKARLITILVAPLMSCSARLPVYALMIGAFVPNRRVLGIGRITILTLPGVTLVSMYFLGMIAAFCMAWLFHRTLLKGAPPNFLMELPTYHVPSIKTAFHQMLERAFLFLRHAGTIILAVSIVLWFLSAYPKHPGLDPHEQIERSYVGYLGHAIAPAIAPLGFNWKMGIGIVSSFIAREVFVASMGTVYSVEDAEDTGHVSLQDRIKADTDPRTGRKLFTPLVAVCLMVYYVLAMQCVSTLAVVRRETNGWRWPLFQLGYMTVLAWIVTLAVYHAGRALGFG
jgi:ferrous iron transport protein B